MVKQNLQSWFLDTYPQVAGLLNKANFLFLWGKKMGVSLQSARAGEINENLVTNYVIKFLYVNRIDLIGTKKVLFGNSRRICFLWKHTYYYN